MWHLGEMLRCKKKCAYQSNQEGDEESLRIKRRRYSWLYFTRNEIYCNFSYKVNVKEHITHYELGLPVKDAPLEELILEYSFDGVNYTKAIETEAKAGRWVGVKSGMFACHDNSIKTEAGYVTVDYVEYK